MHWKSLNELKQESTAVQNTPTVRDSKDQKLVLNSRIIDSNRLTRCGTVLVQKGPSRKMQNPRRTRALPRVRTLSVVRALFLQCDHERLRVASLPCNRYHKTCIGRITICANIVELGSGILLFQIDDCFEIEVFTTISGHGYSYKPVAAKSQPVLLTDS